MKEISAVFLEMWTKSMRKKHPDDEHVVATRIAYVTPGVHTEARGGYYWETKREASNALSAIKALLRVMQSNKPWPDWARMAVENGWKPPKGWKP